MEPHGSKAVASMRASTFAKATADKSAGTRLAFIHSSTAVASTFAEASADKSCEGG